MKELLVASGNKGKLREFGELLKGVVDTILSPADFPGIPEVEEDGETFEANAIKKALSAALFTGRPDSTALRTTCSGSSSFSVLSR